MTGSEALGLVGVLISIAATVWIAMIRYILGLKDKEGDRRLAELDTRSRENSAEQRAMGERLRLDELETERLKGQVGTMSAKIEHLQDELAELRNQQVPRAEWEQQMAGVKEQLQSIRQAVDRRYGSSSSDPKLPSTR